MKYFRLCVKTSHSSSQDAEYLDALFSLVSGGQIAAACRLAHQQGDHNLALALTQVACGNANSRALAYEQLDTWRRMGVGCTSTSNDN